MELPKIEKLLRLIRLLVGNRRTTRELAEFLECDQRTIQRYIVALKDAGFVVEYRRKGVPFMSTQKGSLKDISDLVHFSEEEAYLLHRAIDSIDGTNVIKQNLKKKLYNIYNYPWLADVVLKPELSRVVHNLITAIDDRNRVKLKGYHSANSNTVTDREIEPFCFTTNYEQVWGYEISTGKNKLFKVARIKSVEILDREWEYEAKHAQTKIDVFRNSGKTYIGKAILELNVRAYDLLVEEYPLADKYITNTENNKFLFEAEVCSYEGVCRFVLGLFEDVTVKGDEGLKHFIDKKIEAINLKRQKFTY